VLASFKECSIDTLTGEDQQTVTALFKDFEIVLGPVGAAKSLHLLAPRFFPLWDRAIAKAYGLPLGSCGTNPSRYVRFMEITKEQIRIVGGEQAVGRNPLKAIDEYNYCRYTRRSM
jgi:hypothetical protein